jgi:hypothetical protein
MILVTKNFGPPPSHSNEIGDSVSKRVLVKIFFGPPQAGDMVRGTAPGCEAWGRGLGGT